MKASLGVIFGVVFLDLLGFGLLITQLGIYAVKFQGSAPVIGLLLSVYSLMQLIFAPVLGRLSDRYGRRPVLLYSLFGSFIGYVLFAFAHSLPLLFLSRVIDGISGGNISTAQAYVSDVTTPENRAKGMGMVGAAFGLGFVLGPAIGGLLGKLGGNFAIGVFAAGLTAANFLFALFALPESLKARGAGKSATASKSLSSVRASFHLPVIGLVLVLFLLFTTAFSQMEGTFSVFLIVRHLSGAVAEAGPGLRAVLANMDDPLAREASAKAGWLFVAVGVVSAVVQGGLIGRLKNRFGEATLASLGCALVTLGLLTIPLAPTYAWLFGPIALLSAGSGLINPSLSSLVSRHAPSDQQGTVLGAYQAMGSLGRIIGPLLGGFLFSVGASLPYYVAAAMTALCVVGGRLLLTRVRTQGTNG